MDVHDPVLRHILALGAERVLDRAKRAVKQRSHLIVVTYDWATSCRHLPGENDYAEENNGTRYAEPGDESDQEWLDLEHIATMEVTSEDPSFPIESAIGSKDGPGWRASQAGEQQIRIIFDEPISLRRIQLCFHEVTFERTQEFTLRWAPATGGSTREIVRQQWNFSPTGSTAEIEDYVADLDGVSVLELAIQPDANRWDAVATLASWRLG
jgi:hypothetical protein